MKPKNIRKVYLIEREVQFAYAKEVFIALVVFALILIVLMFLPSVIELYKPITGDVKQAASAKEFLSINARLWPSLLVTAILLAIMSVYRSHRFAGPIYRFKKTTETIGAGRIDYRVKLRKTDFLKDFERIYNCTIDTFDKKISDTKRSNKEIEQYVDTLLLSAPDERLTKIKELSAHIESELAYFTTSSGTDDVKTK